MKTCLVELDVVSRDYEGGKIKAVHQVSLKIYGGEFIALLGTSGSGKSTLLNLMTGLDLPTDGKVRFMGPEPASRSQWSTIRAQHIGFIFQSFNLLPTLTALENVEVPMFGNGLTTRQRSRRAQHLLERVGLSDRETHLPSRLSGGERQRVAIARSLANKPTLLVADEPTGNLDNQTSQQIMELLEEVHLSEKNTLFMVTHDQTLAQRASRVIHIIDGQLQKSS